MRLFLHVKFRMYSETRQIFNDTFKLACESVNIFANQGSLKEMLQTGMRWLNEFSLEDLQKMADIQEQDALLICQFPIEELESLNNKLCHPVESLILEIDLETKYITFRFFMNG